MLDKTPAIFYCLLGLALGLCPFWMHWRLRLSFSISQRNALGLILLSVFGISAFFLGFKNAFLLEVLALLAIWGAFRTGGIRIDKFLTLYAVLLVSATLPWWQRVSHGVPGISDRQLVAFSILVAGTIYLLTSNAETTEGKKSKSLQVGLFAFFTILSGFFVFSTGDYHDEQTLETALHHWGAYIAPSEMVGTGARLFRDIPAQYGLGPTLLILMTHPIGYWRGIYFLAGAVTWLQTLMIALLALKLKGDRRTTGETVAILVIVLLATLFWTAYPPHVTSVTATPSVSGMRFLPVLSLVMWLFWKADDTDRKDWRGGFAFWAVACLWSPESAFYGTFVWWPYFLYLRAHEGGGPSLVAFCREAAILLLSLLALIGGFLAAYACIYRTTPTFYGYFAYVINPPGPLPIDPLGTIWFFLLVMGLGIARLVMIRQPTNKIEFRRLFLLLLLAYATFSYYIGRSHDNNILNLMPFQVLVLLALVRLPATRIAGIAVVLLAATVGWASVFGWKTWQRTICSKESLAFRSPFNQGDPRNDPLA